MSAPPSQLQAALAERYRLETEAGAGGMATVYAAEDVRHRRRVAIKVLNPELAAAIGPERFLREIEIAAKLSHPHILPLFDSGVAAGFLYYVMPFAEGESLRERLARELQLPVEESVRFAREVCDALAYAHEHGVVHRDIKPDNILLIGGHAVVADFGIARAIGAAGASSLTHTGIALGTPAYMSPEQASADPRLDARSDLYSLGCVLYEMLAGQPPFTGPSSESVMHQHLSVAAPRITGLRPVVSPAVEKVVARALAKSPADRFADGRSFARALEQARTAPAADARARPIGRRVALAGTAVVLAVLAGIGMRNGRSRFGCTPSPGAIQSLAVLPLVNYSRDVSQDYFVDGITEELINQLAQISALRVISRTSVMSLKGTRLPVPEIAHRLGVDAVIEGSVARDGDQLRVDAALVQANPERQLWGQSYARQLRELLALQSEVAQTIASQIRVKLTPEEHSRLARVRSIDPAAHEAYLRGRFNLNKVDEKSYRVAIAQFETAIKLDPGYAQAWAGLADTYYYISNTYLPPGEAIPRARAAARRALELDGELGEAHSALAVTLAQYDWDWGSAEREFRRALELSPNDAATHLFFGTMLSETGRFEEAEKDFARARELDPLSDYIIGVWIQPDYLGGHYDVAIARCQRLAEVEPDYHPAYVLMGLCHVQQGKFDQAIAELRKAVSIADNPGFPMAVLGYACGMAGRTREARGVLDTLTSISQRSHVSAYGVAIVHAALGEKDAAFEWLEKSYRNRDEDLDPIKVDPALKSLHSDPRFHDLLRRMKLEG